MRRRTGAIFRDRRPATIIRSDCRGEPRKTSAPKRAMSYRPQLIAIISMAQQARPNVTGQIADRLAHWTIFSTVVVRTGRSLSDIGSDRLGACTKPEQAQILARPLLRVPLQSNAPLRQT